jgi:GNAT superfamily N-acetyltransferase
MNISMRDYTDDDAVEAGRLVADTYGEFNLSFASPDQRILLLGPFAHARSLDEAHQREIAEVLESPIFYVAETEAGEIVGILRGRDERLASLFVRKDYHYHGIGRRLVKKFEGEMISRGISVIRLAATLYAVPFYLKVGYKKSTGVRPGWSFDGQGLIYQPMKKILRSKQEA